MKDLQQQSTISYGRKGKKGQYTLELPPPSDYISYRPEIVGKRFGWVEIIGPEKRWNKRRNHCYVLTQCTGCGAIRWQTLDLLTSGKSKGCQACSQPRQIPEWLYKRLTAAKQRCENPKDKGYKNYGARGIKFDFSSVTEAGLYLIKTFGLPDRVLEIDRIDTNKDYAIGNLRFATHTTNCVNQRRCVLTKFDQKYWPYGRTTTIKKLSHGMTRAEVIADAEKAVREKRKNWRLISDRLKSMIYEMPEDIIVLPYQTT
jgi:hypothetical protein